MKINRNSWHYRLQDALEMDPWKKNNLCSYFWNTVLSMLLGIMVAFPLLGTSLIVFVWWVTYRSLDKVYKSKHGETFAHYDKYLFALVLGTSLLAITSGLGALFYNLEPLESAWTVYAAAFSMSVICSTGLYAIIKRATKDAGKYKLKPETTDDLLSAWLKAKKQKICPLIEFTE